MKTITHIVESCSACNEYQRNGVSFACPEHYDEANADMMEKAPWNDDGDLDIMQMEEHIDYLRDREENRLEQWAERESWRSL